MVKRGTPQFPDFAQCKQQFNDGKDNKTKLETGAFISEIAWQFADDKIQRYGDCYVFGAVSSVEAAINRVYLKKPQIGISDQHVELLMFSEPQHFSNLSSRLLEPIKQQPTCMSEASAGGSFACNLFSGGDPDQVLNYISQLHESLLLVEEFNYQDLEEIMEYLRGELKSAESAAKAYGDLSQMLEKVERRLSANNSARAVLAAIKNQVRMAGASKVSAIAKTPEVVAELQKIHWNSKMRPQFDAVVPSLRNGKVLDIFEDSRALAFAKTSKLSMAEAGNAYWQAAGRLVQVYEQSVKSEGAQSLEVLD